MLAAAPAAARAVDRLEEVAEDQTKIIVALRQSTELMERMERAQELEWVVFQERAEQLAAVQTAPTHPAAPIHQEMLAHIPLHLLLFNSHPHLRSKA
jgi:hypothetical protein